MSGSRSFLIWRVLLAVVPAAAGVGVYVATDSILYGTLGLVGAFVVIVAFALRMAPASTKVGTRAWEAGMNANLLVDVIASRRAGLATATESERGKFEREIAFLEAQLAEQRAIAASNDASPGVGHVGFKAYDGD